MEMMTDPLTPQARKDMIDCAYTDAILSLSFERRKDAQFEDGYTGIKIKDDTRSYY